MAALPFEARVGTVFQLKDGRFMAVTNPLSHANVNEVLAVGVTPPTQELLVLPGSGSLWGDMIVGLVPTRLRPEQLEQGIAEGMRREYRAAALRAGQAVTDFEVEQLVADDVMVFRQGLAAGIAQEHQNDRLGSPKTLDPTNTRRQ